MKYIISTIPGDAKTKFTIQLFEDFIHQNMYQIKHPKIKNLAKL